MEYDHYFFGKIYSGFRVFRKIYLGYKVSVKTRPEVYSSPFSISYLARVCQGRQGAAWVSRGQPGSARFSRGQPGPSSIAVSCESGDWEIWGLYMWGRWVYNTECPSQNPSISPSPLTSHFQESPSSVQVPVSIVIYVYLGPVGMEYRVQVTIDIITLQNDSCICGASGHIIQSPSQHRC